MNKQSRKVLSMAALALAASLSIGLATGVLAQNVPPSNTLTTSGHGEVKVRPDSLSLQATVETKNANLVQARNENNKKAQAIIAALKGLNIPNMKLETQGLNVYPIQDYQQKDKLPKVVGYQVNNGVNITVTGASPEALSEYGSRIVDTALNAGANHVGGLNFFLNNPNPARMQALAAAVKDARQNADVIAKAADISIVGVHSIEGSPQFGGFPRPMPMYAMKSSRGGAEAADSSAPVEVGETTVTSDVTIRYKF